MLRHTLKTLNHFNRFIYQFVGRAIDGGTTDAWQVYTGYAQSGTNSAGQGTYL